MPAILEKEKNTVKKKGRPKIPDYLVYEILGNKKIYYRGYEKVLSGELPPEAIMGSSSLQAWIVALIVRFLINSIDYKKYLVLTNEVGYFYTPQRKGKWLNLDIAILDRKKFGKPTDTYLKVPPEVVIEIDTKADLSKIGDNYYIEKTKRLLESGIKKVVWLFTEQKKIQIAEKGIPWLIVDFDYEFEMIDGVNFNLKKLLEEDGVKLWGKNYKKD
ncbi:MAG: Uma2 family endonuclease [Desulfurobacterium sp.]|nr:MAG: Uma2 family endonuclease [Desulfurobacterium sp.]